MAVEVRQLAPPADVGCLVEHAEEWCGQAPAGGARREFFGCFDYGHGQSCDERAGGAASFLGQRVEGSVGAYEVFWAELRPCVVFRGCDPGGDLAVGEA